MVSYLYMTVAVTFIRKCIEAFAGRGDEGGGVQLLIRHTVLIRSHLGYGGWMRTNRPFVFAFLIFVPVLTIEERINQGPKQPRNEIHQTISESMSDGFEKLSGLN